MWARCLPSRIGTGDRTEKRAVCMYMLGKLRNIGGSTRTLLERLLPISEEVSDMYVQLKTADNSLLTILPMWSKWPLCVIWLQIRVEQVCMWITRRVSWDIIDTSLLTIGRHLESSLLYAADRWLALNLWKKISGMYVQLKNTSWSTFLILPMWSKWPLCVIWLQTRVARSICVE